MRHFVAAAAAYFLAVQQANQRLKFIASPPMRMGTVEPDSGAERALFGRKQGNKSAGLSVRNPRRGLHHPICICLDLRGCLNCIC